jgi:hypothetical protein
MLVTVRQTDSRPDLLDQIPDPEIVRGWLAESVRRSDLLRSLLRVAIRKAAHGRRPIREQQDLEAPSGIS